MAASVATLAVAMEQVQQQVGKVQGSVDDLVKQADLFKRINERVIIFVDRSNLDGTWHRLETGGLRPDYLAMTKFLADGRFLRQVRIYYSDVDESAIRGDEELKAWQGRQDFYKFLRYQGWLLRFVRKRSYEGNHVEKGLDAALIRDMETLCRDGRCDTAILVAGDGDYSETVWDCRDRYCMNVEVAFFPQQTASDLRQNATKFINLECNLDKISRRPQRQ